MNKALYNYIRFSEDEIRWEGKRVSNSLAASQFSRHFRLIVRVDSLCVRPAAR